MSLDNELTLAFDGLYESLSERNWEIGRLGVKDGVGGYDIPVPDRPGYVYVSKGINGEQGFVIAEDRVGVDVTAEFQRVRMRRELNKLVIRDAEYLVSGTGGTGGAVLPHDLDDTAVHTGTLASAQFPQGLLTSGARNLTGNLGVDAGITIDGVDISAHAANPAAHHNPVTVGNTGLSLSTQVLSLNLATDPGLEISSGLRAKVYNGILRDANGIGVNEAFDFVWEGDHTWNTGVATFNTDPQINANLDFIGGDRLITANAQLTIQPTGELWFNPASNLIVSPNDIEWRSQTISDLPTGISGHRLWDRGGNESQFNVTAIKADELRVRAFVADAMRVSLGEEMWGKSRGIVAIDFVVPADEVTVDVWFEGIAELPGFDIFELNDWVLVRSIDVSSGLTVQKIWFQVVFTKLDDDVTVDGIEIQQWQLRRKSGGITGTTIKAGSVVPDMGVVGQGMVDLSALISSGGPFLRTSSFDSILSDVPQFIAHAQMGNLTGTVDYTTDTWGFVAGDNLGLTPAGGFRGLAADATNGLRLFNTDIALYDSATLSARLNIDSGLTFLQDTGELAHLERIVSWHSDLSGTPADPIAFLASYDSGDGHLFHMGVEQTGSDVADTASIYLNAYQATAAKSSSITLNAPGSTGVSSISLFASEVMIDGDVRIGTGRPGAALDVDRTTDELWPIVRATVFGSSVYHFLGRRAGGTAASPTEIATGQVLLTIGGLGYTDEGWATAPSGELSLRAVDNFNNGADFPGSAEWVFLTHPLSFTGTMLQRLSIGWRGVQVGMADNFKPTLLWEANGQYWSAGIDIADDYWKISVDSVVGDNDALWIDPVTRIVYGNFSGATGSIGTETMHNAATSGDGIDVTGTQVISLDSAIGGDGLNYAAGVLDVDSTVVRTARTLTSGGGLTGGGDLSANRTLAVGAGDGITVNSDDVAVDSTVVRTSRTLTAGGGLTGGGDLSANRTVAIRLHSAVFSGLNIDDGLTIDATAAGGGLGFSAGIFAVGAGSGITVNANDVAVDSTVVRTSRTILPISGGGLTGGGDLSANRTFGIDLAVGVSGLNVTSGLAIDASVGGDGLTLTAGVLDVDSTVVRTSRTVTAGAGLTGGGDLSANRTFDVGAGVGITVAADSVAINQGFTPTWTAAHIWNAATTFNSDPQIGADLDFIGGIRSITSAGTDNLNIAPGGDLVLNPTGTDVLPGGSVAIDLGDYNRKWRSLFAAELVVQTLVAQSIMATIGGRVMVTNTTTLIADMTNVQTTIDVKHEIFDSGDYIYLEAAPGGVAQIEAMKVTSAHTTIAGGYRYTVTRNLDGTGANSWVTGDAVVDHGGAVGDGFIDLTSTATVHNHLGPTITIYSRTATTNWNDVKPVVTMGNLSSFVDYSGTEFGFAVGNDLTLDGTNGFSGLTVDRTDGIRLFNTELQWLKPGEDPYTMGIDPTTGALKIAQGTAVTTNTLMTMDTNQVIMNQGLLVNGDTQVVGTFYPGSGGVDFSLDAGGGNALTKYKNSTWSPVITAVTPGTMSITYTTQSGRYTHIGDMCFFTFYIHVNTYSAGTASGELQITMPLTTSVTNAYLYTFALASSGLNWPGTPIDTGLEIVAGTNKARFYSNQDNGARQYVVPGDLAAGDVISATGWFFV